MTVRRIVVFPAPFRPTRQTSAPGSTASDTSRRMWLDWMKTLTASSRSTGRAPGASPTGPALGLDAGAARPPRPARASSARSRPAWCRRGPGPAGERRSGPSSRRRCPCRARRAGSPATPMPREARTSISMTAVLSRVDTPLVGSSRRITSGRRANAAATSRSFLSPCGSVRLGDVELARRGRRARPRARRPAGPRRRRRASRGAGGRGPRRDTTAAWRVSAHRELGEDLDELEAPGEAEPREPDRADAPDVAALEAHGAAARPQEPGQDVDQRRLAGAVRADDRDELAGLDAEGHAVERAEVAVVVPDLPRPRGSPPRRLRRPARAATRPARPVGAKITSAREDGAEDEPPVGEDRHHGVLEVDEDEGAQDRARRSSRSRRGAS